LFAEFKYIHALNIAFVHYIPIKVQSYVIPPFFPKITPKMCFLTI
jgi:hypothetical protein